MRLPERRKEGRKEGNEGGGRLSCLSSSGLFALYTLQPTATPLASPSSACCASKVSATAAPTAAKAATALAALSPLQDAEAAYAAAAAGAHTRHDDDAPAPKVVAALRSRKRRSDMALLLCGGGLPSGSKIQYCDNILIV